MALCRISKMGMVSALGEGAEETWASCLKGGVPLSKTQDYLTGGQETMVGRVIDLAPLPPQWKQLDSKNNRLAYAAYLQIQDQVEQALAIYPKQRIALVMGTSTGGMLETEHAFFNHPLGQPTPDFSYPVNEISSLGKVLGEMIGVAGPCYTIATACSSSANAIISGARLLESGLMDAVIVGGVDSLCKMTTNGFNSLGLLSSKQSIPFMKGREGLNIGEAAALALLERKPGGIQLKGYGQSADAHHISAPDPQGKGAQAAMAKPRMK